MKEVIIVGKDLDVDVFENTPHGKEKARKLYNEIVKALYKDFDLNTESKKEWVEKDWLFDSDDYVRLTPEGETGQDIIISIETKEVVE